MAKAKLEYETNSFAWQKEKAKLGNQSKILARAKKKSAELAGMIKTPSSDPVILEIVLGALNLPVSLEAKDRSFATPTKVRVMGRSPLRKSRRSRLIRRKRRKGFGYQPDPSEVSGRGIQFDLLGQRKGKYRLYDELEKNATEQKAKEVADSLASLKKQTDDAKKKLDADKKGLAAKEAELKKRRRPSPQRRRSRPNWSVN